MSDTPHRSCKVGIYLPTYEGAPGHQANGWTDVRTLAQLAESLGFDSVWLFDHLLLPVDEWIEGAEPLGAWECWSTLTAVAASTEQVEIGSLVLCAAYRNPALIAKMAVTVDEISNGRLILGLGAGSLVEEFSRIGLSARSRISRFEEAVQIITGLLRYQEIDFHGHFYDLEQCVLRPQGPREHGPPVMLGARGERMFRITARYADLWNGAWPNRAELMQPRLELLDEACRLEGRDPATLGRTAGVMIDLEKAAPNHDWVWTFMANVHSEPLTGSTEKLAAELRKYQRQGIEHFQIWLNPTTVAGLEAFAPVLDLLE